MVYVYNPETAQAGDAEIRDGKFKVTAELRTGTYVAFITPIPPPPPNPENPPSNLYGAFPKNFPEKYQRQDQSDLRIEVKEGENEVTLAVP